MPHPNGASGVGPRPTRVRAVLSGWLAATAIIAYLCRNSLAVAESTIRADLGVSETTMGFLLGPAFFWSYALAQIPAGWLGQRCGARRLLPAFSIMSALATALLGLAQGATALLFGRLASGVAQAGLFPCATLAISRWYPRIERGTASGILGAAMSVGGALGAALTGELLELTSWRALFVLYALPGLAWGLGFLVWFRETPREHPAVNDAERTWIEQAGGGDNPAAAPLPQLTAATLSCICGQQFFRAAGYAFFASWFATFLQETRGVSTAGSGWLLTIPLLATVVASLLGGGLSDWLLRYTGQLRLARAGLAAVALVLCATLVFSAYFVEDAASATLVISAGAFCAGLAGPCGYAVTIDVGGAQVATVFGAMNMIGNFGAGLLPWVVPPFRRWIDARPAALDMCGGNSWNAVLVLFAAMYLAAAVFWMCLPLRTKSPESPCAV